MGGHFASLVVSRTSAAQRRFAAYRGTSLRSCFQKKGFRTALFLFSPFPPFFFFDFFFSSPHLRGFSGHFASLVVSRKSASQRRFAAYRGTSLRSCFQKK